MSHSPEACSHWMRQTWTQTHCDVTSEHFPRALKQLILQLLLGCDKQNKQGAAHSTAITSNKQCGFYFMFATGITLECPHKWEKNKKKLKYVWSALKNWSVLWAPAKKNASSAATDYQKEFQHHQLYRGSSPLRCTPNGLRATLLCSSFHTQIYWREPKGTREFGRCTSTGDVNMCHTCVCRAHWNSLP